MTGVQRRLFVVCFTLMTVGALQCSGNELTNLGSVVVGNGYTFLNFNGPNAGGDVASGTNMNGISNSGSAIGFDIDNAGNLHNFVANVNSTQFNNPSNPYGTATTLSLNPGAMALGINAAGTVVGGDGLGNALVINTGNAVTFIPNGGSNALAIGINDKGNIVGQYTNGNGQMPGFYVTNQHGNGLVRIDSPSGPDTVNAQGINNHGQVVGFYVGTDGNQHGFTSNINNAQHGQITGTAIADPTVPNVAGEPGATFVFSQLLGVNDQGLVAGYYGDSTISQHGFIYNLNTGQYTFIDDPAEGFDSGVETTQITGINNQDEITGFYADPNGVLHGFLACPTGQSCAAPGLTSSPEPASLMLAGLGLAAAGLGSFRRLQRKLERRTDRN